MYSDNFNTNNTKQDIFNIFISDNNGNYTVNQAIAEDHIIEAAHSLLINKVAKHANIISNPGDTRLLLTLHFAKKENEIFTVVFLNNKNQVIAIEDMFRGTVNKAQVYPREIVKLALKLNTVNVIFAHNHPSGNPEPSVSNIELTNQLKAALALVDINVLDHFVIGADKSVSFAERHLL